MNLVFGGSWQRMEFILTGILFFLSGCGYQSKSDKHQYSSSLVFVDTLHLQELDTLFLGEFRSVAVALNPFRLYVPDRRLRRVVVYDKAGRPIRIIGRPGFEEPGALLGPLYVSLFKDKVYVQEIYNRIVVFDSTGKFLFNREMPEFYYPEFPIRFIDDKRVVVASTNIQEPCSNPYTKPCKETKVLSVLDIAFTQIKDRFGIYPTLYLKRNLVVRSPRIDVNSEKRIIAVGYSLSPEIQFYALTDTGGVLFQTVKFVHPEWHSPDEDIPANLAVKNRKKWESLMLKSSQLFELFFVADTLVLAYFVNKHPKFYSMKGWGDEDIEPYGVLVSLSGVWQQALELPGPVLGRDEAFHLYIRLSDEPGRRLIGRYRVEVRR